MSQPAARPMVLRSINLPAEMDEQLRSLAFYLRRPKADLMRHFVRLGFGLIAQRLERASSEQVIHQLQEEIDADGSSAQDRENIDRELAQALNAFKQR